MSFAYRYVMSFDKRGRLVEKRTFPNLDVNEARAYMHQQIRKGYRVEETFDESIYNKY